MDRGYSGLQLERAGLAAAQARSYELVAFTDQRPVPTAAVLVGEANHRPVGSHASGAAGLREQHQREQPDGFGFIGHQLDEGPPEPDSFARQVGSRERLPCGSGVTFGEDEVDRREDNAQPVREFRSARYTVGAWLS